MILGSNFVCSALFTRPWGFIKLAFKTNRLYLGHQCLWQVILNFEVLHCKKIKFNSLKMILWIGQIACSQWDHSFGFGWVKSTSSELSNPLPNLSSSSIIKCFLCKTYASGKPASVQLRPLYGSRYVKVSNCKMFTVQDRMLQENLPECNCNQLRSGSSKSPIIKC